MFKLWYEQGISSHVVVTPINRLCGVDGSWLRQKLGISVFVKTAPVAKLLSWQQHKGCHFVSFDIYGAKFQEQVSRDIVYSVFTTFQLQYYNIITDVICIREKRQYL